MKFKKVFLLLFIIFLSTSCTNKQIKKGENFTCSKTKEEDAFQYFKGYDPLEPLNRRIYYFNYQFDKYVFIPAVKTYQYITPDILETGVNNFFDNARNITTTGNALLQGKIRKSMKSIARLTINLTLGLGGLFDVASTMGIPTPYEDFGLTLAHYGIGNGPYLVLPLLGPSNLRDGFGKLVDTFAKGTVYHEVDIDSLNTWPVTMLYSINERKNIPFRYYESGSPFEYEYVRFIYNNYRMIQSEVDNKIKL